MSASRTKTTRIRELPRIAAAALVLAASVLAAERAAAHHSFAAEFDVKRPVELTGKVTKVELINPHSWIHLEVAGADGKNAEWMIEGGSPNSLFKRGVTKQSIPLGSEIVVKGYQARDGSNRAVGRDIAFADGRPLFFEGSKPDAPQPEKDQ
ncbi:MAG TPA: DUF6152 family protein [Gammaproteobacteria bacterium]|nr:DUF6152 family protein [Gammaproteobacteria bacterium]